MRHLSRVLVLVLGAWFFAGCGSSTPPPEHPRPEPLAQSEGAGLYARYCALCHGENGEGYAADNATRLRGEGFLRTATDRFLGYAIARGRPDTAMAAYSESQGGPLSDEQVDSLVQHIRTWQTDASLELPDENVQGDAQVGEGAYAEHCAGCHGSLGEGNSAQSLSNWTFLTTANDAFVQYAIVHGRPSTPMPAFAESLPSETIDSIVTFIRQWETQPDYVPAQLRPPDLAQVQVIVHPDGPTPQFELRQERFVAAAQVRAALEANSRMILLDARATSDWLRRRIPGAVPVPYYDIEPIIERLPRDGTWIVAYCGCPHAASGQVVDALREAGFEHTAVLDEGVHHWISRDYPTESGPVEVSSPAQD